VVLGSIALGATGCSERTPAAATKTVAVQCPPGFLAKLGAVQTFLDIHTEAIQAKDATVSVTCGGTDGTLTRPLKLIPDQTGEAHVDITYVPIGYPASVHAYALPAAAIDTSPYGIIDFFFARPGDPIHVAMQYS
jgi:hypothetical protein